MTPTALTLFVQTGLVPTPTDPTPDWPSVPTVDLAALGEGVSAARLVVLPMRSLRGIVTYVTCPTALRGLDVEPPHPEPHHAIVADGCPCVIEDRVVIEEFGLVADVSAVWASLAHVLTQRLLPQADDRTRQRWTERLILIDDALLVHLAEYAVPQQVRRRLGEVTRQAMFPPETVLTTSLTSDAATAWIDRASAHHWLGHGRGVGTGLVCVTPLAPGVSP